jgi:hypothetical protein
LWPQGHVKVAMLVKGIGFQPYEVSGAGQHIVQANIRLVTGRLVFGVPTIRQHRACI